MPMKVYHRAATAMLSLGIVAGGVLAAPTVASASPALPVLDAGAYGTWANVNPATTDLRNIVVTPAAGGAVLVDGFGACTPTSCEWGQVPATVFGPNVSSGVGEAWTTSQSFGFADDVLTARLTHTGKGQPLLVVQDYVTFLDGSGRSNFTVTDKFRPAPAISPTIAGTVAAGFPAGAPVHPVASLAGTWINNSSSPATSDVILSQAADGSLLVHAYGNCVPTACDMGQVGGVTFGAGPTSTTGRRFLAPYAFGFKNELMAGSLSADGATLTVTSYSQFTDGSGRSNYTITETFHRG